MPTQSYPAELPFSVEWKMTCKLTHTTRNIWARGTTPAVTYFVGCFMLPKVKHNLSHTMVNLRTYGSYFNLFRGQRPNFKNSAFSAGRAQFSLFVISSLNDTLEAISIFWFLEKKKFYSFENKYLSRKYDKKVTIILN